MGVMSHYKQAVHYGRCVSESKHLVCRKIGSHIMVLDPFLSFLCPRLECRNIGGHNIRVSLYMVRHGDLTSLDVNCL